MSKKKVVVVEKTAEIEAERNRVSAALEELRASLQAFRRLTGEPPHFIYEALPPPVKVTALSDCKVFPGRYYLLESLPEGGRVAEVGTQHGYWARNILLKIKPEELHLFDTSFKLLVYDVAQNPCVKTHQGDSSNQLSKLPDEYFDWIYIDGDHSYPGVKKDIREAIKKVKRSGMLIFNDYTLWSPLEAIPYGVVAAVNELLNTGEWKMVAIAITADGYWDAALKRVDA